MTTKSRPSKPALSRRPIVDSDMEFLYQLYATTRPEIAQLPWNSEQKTAFLQHQFQAQHTHYQNFFAGAQFDVVLRGRQRVGRVYVNRTNKEYRVIDLAILPEFRGQGIGSMVMQEILEDADQHHKPVRLRVQRNNPARQWYESLGFRKIADEQMSWHMERPAK